MNMHAPPTTAPCGPWILTASGIAFDLLNPTPAMVHWPDVAESLARIPRFNGHIGGGAYSVAQHCVLGARALLEETENPRLAGLFLLHDAHEAYVGDIATPVARAIASVAEIQARLDDWFDPDIPAHVRGDIGRNSAKLAIDCLKLRIDGAIHGAAFAVPPTCAERTAIKRMDARMLATEMRQLWARAPQSLITEALGEAAQLPPVRLSGRLRIWPWPDAADAYLRALHQFFPHLKR